MEQYTLPGDYWLKKENGRWWLWRDGTNLALKIVPSVPLGEGGSIDRDIAEFAAAMNQPKPRSHGYGK